VGWSERRGHLYTFSSSAGTAVRAARKLVKNCLIQIRAAPDTTSNHAPLVAIEVGSFTSANGEIFFPICKTQDWVPIGMVLHSLAQTGSASAFGISNAEALNQDLGEELTPENTKLKSKSRI
jgi:hypothetical protein